MNTITHSQRYLPHKINTKFYAVKLYRSGVGVSFVCRRYHISKFSLLRWNKKFDGTKGSLLDKSHRPLSKHPNAHTDEELKWIRDYHRRNPKISVCELYGKLRTNKGYSRHLGSLYRIYRKLGYSSYAPSAKKKRKPLPYDTPTELGIKWQMDFCEDLLPWLDKHQRNVKSNFNDMHLFGAVAYVRNSPWSVYYDT